MMCKALEFTNELFNIAGNIKGEWKTLHNKLSIADKKKSDVEHFIEINTNLNASQGYKAYKLLKEVLEERRDIKNQIEEITELYNFVVKTELVDSSKAQSIRAKVKNKNILNNSETEGKKYQVRILTEVFGNIIVNN